MSFTTNPAADGFAVVMTPVLISTAVATCAEIPGTNPAADGFAVVMTPVLTSIAVATCATIPLTCSIVLTGKEFSAGGHFEHLLPPQSTPVSLPSISPFEHDTQAPSAQTPADAQSTSLAQELPEPQSWPISWHRDPPQSTSVSSKS
jgi:hypothetical protein